MSFNVTSAQAFPTSSRRGFRRSALRELEEFLSGPGALEFAPSGPVVLSIVVVLHNRAELTLRCLTSLAAQRIAGFELIIADNGSTDRTAALLARISGAVVIRNKENLGYLLAVNAAAARARGAALLLLNNDTVLLPGALQRALAVLAGDPGIGAVGGRVLFPNGRLQEAGSFLWRNASGGPFGLFANPDRPQFNVPRDADYVSGAFLMTRTSIFQALGGFDTSFAPAYYEETDYCFRLRATGYRCVYDPGISLIHLQYGSAPNLLAPFLHMSRNRGTMRDRHAAALAGRRTAAPWRFVRAFSGRKTGPWYVLLAGALPAGSAVGDDRAGSLAIALLDHGAQVSLLRPGSGALDCMMGNISLFDGVVLLEPGRWTRLAGVLAARPASIGHADLICDTVAFPEPGSDMKAAGFRAVIHEDILAWARHAGGPIATPSAAPGAG